MLATKLFNFNLHNQKLIFAKCFCPVVLATAWTVAAILTHQAFRICTADSCRLNKHLVTDETLHHVRTWMESWRYLTVTKYTVTKYYVISRFCTVPLELRKQRIINTVFITSSARISAGQVHWTKLRIIGLQELKFKWIWSRYSMRVWTASSAGASNNCFFVENIYGIWKGLDEFSLNHFPKKKSPLWRWLVFKLTLGIRCDRKWWENVNNQCESMYIMSPWHWHNWRMGEYSCRKKVELRDVNYKPWKW